MVYQALQAGVPVLGIASNMDQLLMMNYVERAGLGKLLRADSSVAGDIGRAAEFILNSAEARTAAQRAGRQIAACDPQRAFEAAALELFNQHRGVYDRQQRRVQNM